MFATVGPTQLPDNFSNQNVHIHSVLGRFCRCFVYAVCLELSILTIALLGFERSFTGWRGVLNSYNALMVLNFPSSVLVAFSQKIAAMLFHEEKTLLYFLCTLHFVLGTVQWTLALIPLFGIKRRVSTEQDKSFYQNLANTYGPISNKLLGATILATISVIGFLLVVNE